MSDSEIVDDVPEGVEFLKLVRRLENKCDRKTSARRPRMGKRAPECYERLGTILSILDRESSCFWECNGGDHIIEYLCGRTANCSRAALRLMQMGFYDESLVLIRSVGEIANLIVLFKLKPGTLDDWQQCTRQQRLRTYSPVKVRLLLEAGGEKPPISEERYSRLCEVAAHVHPGTVPQAHNPLRRPVCAGIYQEIGFLICLNELALASTLVASFASLLIVKSKPLRKRITQEAAALARSLGGANIIDIDEYYKAVSAA